MVKLIFCLSPTFILPLYPVSMTSKRQKTVSGTSNPIFKKVGENLYRHTPSANYYALLRWGGKQFRRSLKTSDRTPAHRRFGSLSIVNSQISPYAEGIVPIL
jgi:hypothetical protein